MAGQEAENILARLLSAEAKVSPRARREAKAPSCEHWTAPVLLERAAYLRKMARAGQGSASDTIRDYPGHRATLSVRLRSGPGEQHEDFAAVLMVLDGRATLVSGGALDKPQSTGPGELTGTGISGGTKTELRAGDVVHVAAGVPHQLLVPADKGFSWLELRIREDRDEGTRA